MYYVFIKYAKLWELTIPASQRSISHTLEGRGMKRRRVRSSWICKKEKEMTPYEEAFKEKKVLVTGGLGFIGSNLCRSAGEVGGEGDDRR